MIVCLCLLQGLPLHILFTITTDLLSSKAWGGALVLSGGDFEIKYSTNYTIWSEVMDEISFAYLFCPWLKQHF